MKTILMAFALTLSFASFAQSNDLILSLEKTGALCNIQEGSKKCISSAKKISKENISCENKIEKMISKNIVCNYQSEAVAQAQYVYDQLPCNTTSIDLEIAKRELSDCLDVVVNSCL